MYGHSICFLKIKQPKLMDNSVSYPTFINFKIYRNKPGTVCRFWIRFPGGLCGKLHLPSGDSCCPLLCDSKLLQTPADQVCFSQLYFFRKMSHSSSSALYCLSGTEQESSRKDRQLLAVQYILIPLSHVTINFCFVLFLPRC